MLASESLLARVSTKRRAFLAGVVAALILIVVLWRSKHPIVETATAPTFVRSLVVLPLETQMLESEYLSYGIAQDLAEILAKVPGVRVAPAPPFITRASDLREVASLVNVGTVLDGAIHRAGAQLRLALRLTAVANDSIIWSAEFRRDSSALVELENQAARVIARILRAHVGLAEVSIVALPKDHRVAHVLVMRAGYLRAQAGRSGLDSVAGLLEHAARVDSSYAPARSMHASVLLALADSSTTPSSVRAHAAAEAATALMLDSTLAEPHITLGRIHAELGRNEEASRALAFAIRLDPGLAAARYEYSRVLAKRGQVDEALREARRAHELDPLAPQVHLNYAHMLARAGHEIDSKHELAELQRIGNYLRAHRAHP